MKFHTSCCRAPKGNGNLKNLKVENILVKEKIWQEQREENYTTFIELITP